MTTLNAKQVRKLDKKFNWSAKNWPASLSVIPKITKALGVKPCYSFTADGLIDVIEHYKDWRIGYNDNLKMWQIVTGHGISTGRTLPETITLAVISAMESE